LRAGYYYAETIEALNPTYKILPAEIAKGFTVILAGIQLRLGFIAAAEKAGLELFIDHILLHLQQESRGTAARKDLGVKSFQAEDEIAGICTSLGASFAGNLAVTSTSGPGLALKSEAIGLAVMAELPL